MLSRRFHLHGLFAVLLALTMQLVVGAEVPRLDPAVQVADVEALCHGTDDAGGGPAKVPVHPIDCLVCACCIAAHPQLSLIPLSPDLMLPRIQVVQRAELPPPPRAPPSRFWSPAQPRAPPSVS